MRVKTGPIRRRRHKKLLKEARGFYGGRSRHFRKAKEQLERSLCYAFRDRAQKKRDFRKLWIMQINAACRIYELSYSNFIHGLKLLNIELDRKSLSNLAIYEEEAFKTIALKVKDVIANKVS